MKAAIIILSAFLMMATAVPATAADSPLVKTINGSDDTCSSGMTHRRWQGISVTGASAGFWVCWNGQYEADLIGTVRDTARDSKSAKLYLRYQYWENPIEDWQTVSSEHIATASGNTAETRFYVSNAKHVLVKDFQVAVCAGTTCTGWS
ncbi:hypothetical protein [Actinocrispum wychmicini]|nr:hypothetical protein [Actinocrispum wychmicini]